MVTANTDNRTGHASRPGSLRSRTRSPACQDGSHDPSRYATAAVTTLAEDRGLLDPHARAAVANDIPNDVHIGFVRSHSRWRPPR